MFLSIIIDNISVSNKLDRILQSINEQICKNYEVIIISDKKCKYDKNILNKNSSNITYLDIDSELTFCQMIKEAIKEAKGDYIQIVDSCDVLEIDWLFQIERESTIQDEVIIGDQIYENSDDKLFYYNFSLTRFFESGILDKKEILEMYLMSGGEDRSLMSINNKVIQKKIMNFLLAGELDTIGKEYWGYIILNAANNIRLVKEGTYIYSLEKEKGLNDKVIDRIQELFRFLSYIKSTINISPKYEKDWWNELYTHLKIYNQDKENFIRDEIENITGEKLKKEHDTAFFENTITELGNDYFYFNNIKNYIISNECEYVGFDIFDTIIERPFWKPTDLFHLLNKEFNKLIGKKTVIDFSLMRENGENACRMYYASIRPSNEDVSLDEIYNFISSAYGISQEITDKLKKREIELEEKYCVGRKIGKVLYSLAQYCNKKIFIASDMYLPKENIENILWKNGYKEYIKLYLSNEIGISKYSGNLFKYILRDLKISEPNRVCFIGDNYSVDFLNSQKMGIIPYHTPKATDLFMGLNQSIYTGDFYKKIYEPNGGIIDQGTAMKFLGIRCMMAVVANKFYGNPFVSMNRAGDFNADPIFIGYYCAGSFLFSEANWLLLESQKNNIKKIHFVARDGYWLKEAYDCLRENFDKGALSNYLYSSRKAIAPLYLQNPEGIYELFLPPHIINQTPEKVVQLLKHVIKPGIDVKNILKRNGIITEKKFANLNEFYVFAKVFRENLYDKKESLKYAEMLKEYYSRQIDRGDVICDIGYSGRVENALTKLLGFPVNSYYFHEHEPWALMRKREVGFHIESFYGFKPCSAFVVREQIFTPNQPSCEGFSIKNRKIEPYFEEYSPAYKEKLVLNVLQNAAIQFVKDMIQIFGQDLSVLDFNFFDGCIPLEFYLHYSKPFDRRFFSAVAFEDEFGTNEVLSIEKYWENEIKAYRLNAENINVDLEPIVQNPVSIVNNTNIQSYESKIYEDGILMRIYSKTVKLLPIGSKRRKIAKKIIGKFF